MERCKRLKDYAAFVNRVRENEKQGLSLAEAVDRAVDSCIEEGILSDILEKNRAKVRNLILYEYDEQKHMEIVRDNAKEEGIEVGIEAGRESERVAIIRKKMNRGLDFMAIADLLELDEMYVKKAMDLIRENDEKTDLQIANLSLLADQGAGSDDSTKNLKK